MSECWPGFRISEWKKGVPVVALLLAVLLFCSGMGKTNVDKNNSEAERKAAENVLMQIRTEMQEEEICLWAPKAILEYARETDASIKLLYGRNMWDEWLNAYSYDVYREDMVSLYRWMEELTLAGQEQVETADADMAKEMSTAGEPGPIDRVRMALEAGTNCILLPENVDEGVVKGLESTFHLRVLNIEGYFLLIA